MSPIPSAESVLTLPAQSGPGGGRRDNATHRHSRRTFWNVLGIACKAAIVVHVAFGVVFAALDLWAMVAVNGGSIALYLAALALFRKRHNALAGAIISVEIVAHAVVASRLLGWDSGFHYYLLVMLPLFFISPRRTAWMKLAMGAALLAVYLALDMTMHRIAPSYAAPEAALEGLRAFNIVATFGLLARLAHAYFTAVLTADARLRTMASTDPLTGALNRRSLLDLADRLVAQDKRFAIVLADVDHFKRVNDTHGHQCGDRVLVAIQRALQASIRPDDAVARWGGEEFVTLLPLTSAVEATAIAERARRTIEASDIAVDDGRSPGLKVTMTFGVAELLPGERPEACVARADAALYRGKAAGRNQVTIAA